MGLILNKKKPLYCKVYPTEEVTSREGLPEQSPKITGIKASDRETIWKAVESLYKTGLDPAIGLCLRRNGHVVLDRAIGHISGNSPGDPRDAEKVPAKPSSLFNLFSASKAVTAMVVHLLDERGVLHLDDPVEEYIPEFGRHGKQSITLRHILTHRAGIPMVPVEDIDLDVLTDPERILQSLYDAKPVSVPGRKLQYHALTGGFVIGEVVKRVTGKTIRQVLRNEIAKPLGFKYFTYGVPKRELPKVAVNAYTGPPVKQPAKYFIKRALGVHFHEAADLSNDPRFLTNIVPSGNVIATPDEACRFYQMMLNGGELDGVRVMEKRTIRRAIAQQTYLELDLMMMVPISYGMGFMLGGDYLSFYGPDTNYVFGHMGFSHVVTWADPERNISAALMTTGKPFATWRMLHWVNLMRTITALSPKIKPGTGVLYNPR